ncbi:MAG: hypothetical protein K6T80_02430 [Firmicutes bacterium]|nr:hypothetical protein [Bacillota bacterium]
MFDHYMLHFWIGTSITTVIAVIAAIFTVPINKEMAEVEFHSSGHNVPH